MAPPDGAGAGAAAAAAAPPRRAPRLHKPRVRVPLMLTPSRHDAPGAAEARIAMSGRMMLRAHLSLRQNWLRVAAVVLSFASIITALVAAQEVYTNRRLAGFGPALGASPLSDGAKLATTVLTAMLIVVLHTRLRIMYTLLQLNDKLLPHQRFRDTELFPQMCIVTLLNVVHCPAYVYGNVTVRNSQGFPIVYDWDSLISIFMFVRLFVLVYNAVYVFSGVEAPGARELARIQRVSFNASFAFRHLLKSRPLVTPLVVYIVAVSVLSYSLFVMERPVCPQTAMLDFSPAANCEFRDLGEFTNALWCILITTLTVGYGDTFAVTMLGRAVSIVAAVVGIINLALIVNAISSSTEFDATEARARIELARIHIVPGRRRAAARVVGSALLYFCERLHPGELATAASSAVAPSKGAGDAQHGLAQPSPRAVTRLAGALVVWKRVLKRWGVLSRPTWAAGELAFEGRVEAELRELHRKVDALHGLRGKVDALLLELRRSRGDKGLVIVEEEGAR